MFSGSGPLEKEKEIKGGSLNINIHKNKKIENKKNIKAKIEWMMIVQ